MSRPRRAAVALGLLLSLGLVGLHVQYHGHAGALWRDEVNSVNLVSLPSFAEVRANLHFDSFPVAWATVLYGWRAAGLGDTDAGLRRLGLLVGLATIAVLWWVGARLGVGPPLVALLLFGMSPSTVIYGDQVRGYGLAALAIAWAMGAIPAFVAHPTAGRFVVAQAAALLAAQTHYANSTLLLAIGAGAAAVCALRRQWRILLAVLGLGLVAGLSIVAVNLTALRYMTQAGPAEMGRWRSLGWLVQVFGHSLAPDAAVLAICWLVASILGVVGLGLAWRAPRAGGEREEAVYAAVTLATALVVFFLAFKQTRVPTNFWHYLSLTVVVALACEIGVSLLARRVRHGAWMRIAGVALGALLAAPGVAATVSLRMTNADLVAKRIATAAGPDDLVVVVPWYFGITFERYYRGRAPWITVPDFDEHKFHRHLLVVEKMKQEDAIRPELEQVERTLRQGGKVWIAGTPVAPDAGHEPPRLPPAPEGGKASAYLESWELQLGALVERHGGNGAPVPLPDAGRVNAWEKLSLVVVEGWR